MSEPDSSAEFSQSESNPSWIDMKSPAEGGVPDLSEYPHNYPGKLLEGEQAAKVLQEYEDAGSHLGDLDIPEEESFDADRVLFDRSFGNGTSWGLIRDRLDPEAVASRKKGVGKYEVNNRKIAFVNGEGYLMAARCTVDNIQALRGAGYDQQYGTVFVPFSNADLPAEDSMAGLHLELYQKLDEQDELVGERPHAMDFLDPDSVDNPGMKANRHDVTIESQATSDRRTTNRMDLSLTHKFL